MNLYSALHNVGLTYRGDRLNNKSILAMNNSSMYINTLAPRLSTLDRRTLKMFLIGDVKNVKSHLNVKISHNFRSLPVEVTLNDIVSGLYDLTTLDGVDDEMASAAIGELKSWKIELLDRIEHVLGGNSSKYVVEIDGKDQFFAIHSSGAILATTDLSVFSTCSTFGLLGALQQCETDGGALIRISMPRAGKVESKRQYIGIPSGETDDLSEGE